MYTQMKSKILLRVCILCKLSFLTGRRFFGKWYKIIPWRRKMIMMRWYYGGLKFNSFDEDEEGVGREGFSKYTYLLMVMNPWPGY